MTDFRHDIGGVPPARSLVERAKAIILQPKLEWPVIDAEPSSIGSIYRSYVIPLAAIGPICALIGSEVFGYGVLGFHWRPSLTYAISQAIISYVLALAMVYVLALIIDALAPGFGGIKNSTNAFKVAAYSSTAGWLAGIFGIFPPIAILALLSLYGLYLLYLGLPHLMRAPADKAIGYSVVVVIVAIVLFIVVAAVGGFIVRAAVGPMLPGPGVISSSAGSVDLGKLDAATKQMAAAAEQAQAAAGQAQGAAAGAAATSAAVTADALKAMLPPALPGGFTRTDLSSGGGQVGGIGGSNATATYTSGDQRIELSLTDMAAAGAFAALGGALNIQSSHETATGYEKTGTVDGRMTTEKWDNSGHNGSYGTIVANRFNIEANGNPASVDGLKAAVASVDLGKLTALVR